MKQPFKIWFEGDMWFERAQTRALGKQEETILHESSRHFREWRKLFPQIIIFQI
jgi:hypothetical protein